MAGYCECGSGSSGLLVGTQASPPWSLLVWEGSGSGISPLVPPPALLTRVAQRQPLAHIRGTVFITPPLSARATLHAGRETQTYPDNLQRTLTNLHRTTGA